MAESYESTDRNVRYMHPYAVTNPARSSQHGLLMTHSLTGPFVPNGAQPNSNNSVDGVRINRHIAEGGSLHENVYTMIDEFRPLVELASGADNNGVSLSSWFRQQPSRASVERQHSTGDTITTPDSFIITLESDGPELDEFQNNTSVNGPNENHGHSHNESSTFAGHFLNNIRQASSSSSSAETSHLNNSNNNNNNDNINYNNVNMVEGISEVLRQNPELKTFLTLVSKYVPFLLILIVKGLYDHRTGILIFIGLFITFSHANGVVTREIAKQSRRSLSSLFIVVCNLLGCVLFIYYIFQDEKLYLSLILIPPYTQPLSMWDLLWIVGVTDFILKLITIILKVAITAIPGVILPYQKRGKCYLFLEATSQFYRSVAPVQPWLYFLLETYQGPEKVVGVFLSAAYMISKGSDLLNKFHFWKNSCFKLLQNMNLGVSPNKDQLHLAGNQCPICHDEYQAPVLLHCRHIFCEACVATWFDRVQTCPLCRAKVVDDPAWRDGTTTYFTQLF